MAVILTLISHLKGLCGSWVMCKPSLIKVQALLPTAGAVFVAVALLFNADSFPLQLKKPLT